MDTFIYVTDQCGFDKCQVNNTIYYYTLKDTLHGFANTPMGPTVGLSVTGHQGEPGQEMIMVDEL